jgi:hypothetical protein
VKSRIRENDENNIYVESKRQKAIRMYKEYYDKIQAIKAMSDGEVNEDLVLEEGTKVKLNYDGIVNDINYARKVQGFKDFVENNKDKIFTVEYDERYKNNPLLVMLKEDTSEVKWLWHSKMDLIAVEDDN